MTNYFKNKNIATISIVAPKACKPRSVEEFGYFLAGLIDSDGSIDQQGYVRIAFHINEISIAYYVKKIIGYGTVRKEKKSFVARYRCTDRAGLIIIADFIRNKLKHDIKIEQFNKRLVSRLKLTQHACDVTTYTPSNLFQNHWLAGFIQGDGSLAINLYKRKHRTSYEMQIIINICQKKPKLLELIKQAFGGSLGYRKSQDTYYYTSNSFTNAVKLIQYLDRFQLMGNKLSQYWLWRTASLLFQKKTHLSSNGQEQIDLIKQKLVRLRRKRSVFEPITPDNLTFRLIKQKAKDS
jgi:LAGLIDADG endonuclease